MSELTAVFIGMAVALVAMVGISAAGGHLTQCLQTLTRLVAVAGSLG